MSRSGAVIRVQGVLGEEIRKLSAFFRRELLVMWSYRLVFLGDWLSLFVFVFTLYFIGRLVDAGRLPQYGGRSASYIQFAAIGVALTSFVHIATSRLVSAIRNEQLMGTLEALLVTPTTLLTLQLGSVLYDLAYVPLRTIIFLLLVSEAMEVNFFLSGFGPVLALLLVFIPFVWGLGMAGAAATLTFKRGGVQALILGLLTVPSTAYFPLYVLPDWAGTMVKLNPLTTALDASRAALLGDAGWLDLLPDILTLLPIAAASLGIGFIAQHFALKRERRRGTLGLY